MSGFRAISLDDEITAHRVLRSLVASIPEIETLDCYTSAREAESALCGGSCDLLFLDVTMPEVNGLDFLRALEVRPVTILVTAYAEYALEAFDLGVRDYLLKPVSRERLVRCLTHVAPLLETGREMRNSPRLAVRSGRGHDLFEPGTITHIEAAGNFTVLHGDREIFASEPLGELAERLAPFGFVRIHKSFAVNRAHVQSIQATAITLSGGVKIPLGRAYKPAVLGTLKP